MSGSGAGASLYADSIFPVRIQFPDGRSQVCQTRAELPHSHFLIVESNVKVGLDSKEQLGADASSALLSPVQTDTSEKGN